MVNKLDSRTNEKPTIPQSPRDPSTIPGTDPMKDPAENPRDPQNDPSNPPDHDEPM